VKEPQPNDGAGQEAAGSHACAVSEGQDWVSRASKQQRSHLPSPRCWIVADLRAISSELLSCLTESNSNASSRRCVTCRNRRVKCDETRPSCLRCRKYGTECGGYLPGRRRPPSSAYGSFATQARALVPKDEGQLGGQLTFQPAMSLFETDLEHRYFRLFSDHIATEICPYFNPETWSRMILQACAADASIRHAAVAIGALGKTYETAQAGSCAVTGQKFTSPIGFPAPRVSIENRSVEEIVASANLATEAYEHHQTALEQYDKALKRMRKDISSGEQSLRTTLLICIIIVCFEAIQ